MPEAEYCVDTQGCYHLIARCQECKFRNEDHLTAYDEAKAHVLKTGHVVDIEKGFLMKRDTVARRLALLGIKGDG